MPVIRIRITSARQNVLLPVQVKASNLIFKRAVIVQYGGVNPNLDGGISVHCSFIAGYSILTNTSDSNDLIVPMDPTKNINDIRFDLSLGDEFIKQSFFIDVLNYNNVASVSFLNTDPGALKYVDIYFEYSNLYDFEIY
tara:strand:+ start:389 stop:805 length:417 start_codon:yes stop_codon:yes gene_type:complete